MKKGLRLSSFGLDAGRFPVSGVPAVAQSVHEDQSAGAGVFVAQIATDGAKKRGYDSRSGIAEF
jgi:hypothetical protein